MKKFENIEYCRVAALLLVFAYHYWVLSGSVPIPVSGLDTIISLGGEIGVTIFFVLSGFGIYCLLRNTGMGDWKLFVRSRFVKVAPLYYFSIALVIGLTPAGGGYLSRSGFWDVATHALFIHNLLERFHGSINGGLWTMGVIFQYYLIAVFLYKFMEKNKHITVLLSILWTVMVKIIVYKYILPVYGTGGTQYFIYGRQLFTSLDNFVLGMYVGTFVWEKGKKMSGTIGIPCLIALAGLLIIWGKFGFRYGIYDTRLSSCVWHSVLAVIISGIVAAAGMMKEANQWRVLRLIGKNEYGIYLLHLPILQNVLQTPLFQKLNSKGYYIVGCICFLVLSFGIGYVFHHSLYFVKKGQTVNK